MLDHEEPQMVQKKSNGDYVRELLDQDIRWKQGVITILQNANIASADDLQELKSLIGV